jgi:hypothetical protein
MLPYATSRLPTAASGIDTRLDGWPSRIWTDLPPTMSLYERGQKGLFLKVRWKDQVQLGFTDLASLCTVKAGSCGEAVDPIVAPLFSAVDADLDVEAVDSNAIGIHLVDDCRAGRIGDYKVTTVGQPELP